jgi:hypothetical protein
MYNTSDILSRMTVVGLSIYFVVVHNFAWWAIATIVVGAIVLLSTILELCEVWL